MTPLIPLRVALEDPDLLGAELSADSWLPMRALALAAMGEELTDEERVHFRKLTAREYEPLQRVRRFVCIAGRRSGKSQIAAALCLYLAMMCDHSENLSIGEKGVVLCIAQNQEQARIVYNYCVGWLQAQPVLAKEVANITATAITFKNGIEISVRAASFRGLRGVTLVALVADEIGFWFTEASNSANPDSEIINAVTPALITTKGMLCIISSPYSRRGILWKFYNKHFGEKGGPLTLVAQGASRDFNSTIEQSEIDAALEEDYAVAQAEWLGLFRTDIESFVSLDAVNACVVPGLVEIPYENGEAYTCFIDASTGAGGDSFAAAIGHLRNGDILAVDAIRNFQPKFSPEAVVAEIAQLCNSYGVTVVHSDKFASGFVSELFIKNGIRHEFVALNKSQLYINLLSVINARKIELPDDRRTIQELVSLERRTGFAGQDRVDHPPGTGCHDDSANVIAGLTSVIREGLAGGFSLMNFFMAWGNYPDRHTLARMSPADRAKAMARLNADMRGH